MRSKSTLISWNGRTEDVTCLLSKNFRLLLDMRTISEALEHLLETPRKSKEKVCDDSLAAVYLSAPHAFLEMWYIFLVVGQRCTGCCG